MSAAPLSTTEDHDRVYALPSYRRWLDSRSTWEWKWRQRQEARATKMREKAEVRYSKERERIEAWREKHATSDAAYEAWKVEDERRYWALRKA